MSSPLPTNLVHESETQRQHVRASVPGYVEFTTEQGAQRFRLHDLSGGGLGFFTKGASFEVGQRIDAQIQLSMEAITITVPACLSIRYCDQSTSVVGARFENLGASEVATVRRVVSSFVAGELIGAGDVMHTLSRNNFTAPRRHAAAKPARSSFARFRTMAQTSLIMLFGVAALLYTVHRVNEKMFGANSSAGRVSGPSYQVSMPRDGVFRSLVPEDGVVQKGTPIGSFETSMFGLVSAQALEAALTPQQIDALLGKQIKGTVTSPCDCRVTAMYASNDQYVGKGERLADLAPLQFEPHVLARFNYREAGRLLPGTAVTMRINGEPLARAGTVSQVRGADDFEKLSSDVVVVIKPSLPLPMNLVSRPVQVSAQSNGLISDTIERTYALVGDRAEARP